MIFCFDTSLYFSAKMEFQDLNPEQRQALLAILLSQIKPFIKKKNLSLPEIKGMNILIVSEKNTSVLPSNHIHILIHLFLIQFVFLLQ